MRLRFLRFKQRQSRKKSLELFYRIHVCCVYNLQEEPGLPHNSTSLRVSSLLHVATIAHDLLWEAFRKFSDTIRICPFTARFLCLHRCIKPWIIEHVGNGLETRAPLRRYCTFVGEVFDLMRVMCGPIRPCFGYS